MGRGLIAVGAAALALASMAAPAQGALETHDVRFKASDGVELLVRVGGEGPLEPKPTIVEFSPYGPGCCAYYGGPDFNYLQVHIRGTGQSDGRFDALGPRSQQDVTEVLEWACDQPWSNGRLGIYGASASAIMFYNSLHRELPCVEGAVMWAGTHELYRDLMYPGGMPNLVPAAGVFALIGQPTLQAVPERLARLPLSLLDTLAGMTDTAINYLNHPSIDDFWAQRQFRGDVNDLPILMITGFFDVESRGPFETYRDLRDDGAHLMLIGAHDGVPAGEGHHETAAREAWYQRWLRDVPNGAEEGPRVKLWLADGDREDLLDGRFARVDADDWPVPGTRWPALRLEPQRSGSASSLNDGTLAVGKTNSRPAEQAYPAVPSLPLGVDPHTTSIAFGFGAGGYSGNDLARAVPELTEMNAVEPLGLSYTTGPLKRDVLSAGPANLTLRLRSTAAESDLFAVISDVHPDGSAHPVATGRLRTSYPAIDRQRSLKDPRTGAIVQPYGRYDGKQYAGIGQLRRYQVELWPIGNRFKRGHRIRLHIIGASAYHLPAGAALNSVIAGGKQASRLRFPVLPGSNLRKALP